MFWLNIKRVFKSGFISFWRNGLISVSSIFVMTVTLFIFGSLIIFGAILGSTLIEIQDKVDIDVSFKVGAAEEDILILKKQIEALPEVRVVEYLTRQQVLAQFEEKNKDNSIIMQTLEELDDNPFGATLNVKAKEPSQYQGIAEFLSEKEDASELGVGEDSIIDSVNYYRNKIVIERLTNIISSSRKMGTIVSLALALMSILVAFNTIRLAIYNSREEISVMKLMGANPSYIRGPFVVEGIMYGFFSALLAMFLLYPASLWLGYQTTTMLGSINILTYYLGNFAQLLFVLVISGIVLGIISSYIAVRRYLR